MAGAIRRLFRERGRRGPRQDEAGAGDLARVEAEITAFGEALAAHPFAPDQGTQGPGVLADYQRALDAYEQAKRDIAGDRTPRDTADALRTLDTGRHALACVEAAAEGRPRPHRLPLCFFDPRHGRAAEEVRWAPAGGTARTVAVCAADAVRLAEGRPPVESGLRDREPGPGGERGSGGKRGADEGRGLGEGRGPRSAARARHGTPPTAAPLPAAPDDPYASPPGDVGTRQRREGRGDAGIALIRTGPDAPAVLVVHLDRADGSWVELTDPPVDGPDRQPLTHASALTRAVVPVPSGGTEAVRLQLHTRKGWRVWLHPPEEVPHLDDEPASTGSYVLRHSGGREPLRVTQHSGSAFSLHALRPDHRPGEPLCEGTGAFTARAVLPKKPGLLYVRSRGTWTLTPTGEPKRP